MSQIYNCLTLYVVLQLALSLMCQWHFSYIIRNTALTTLHVLTADFIRHDVSLLVPIVSVVCSDMTGTG